MKTTFVQRRISPIATRVCSKLGWLDRRQLVEGIKKVNAQLSEEAQLHLWRALAASSPLITPRTLMERMFRPKIVLEHALNIDLANLNHFDLSKTVTAKRLVRVADKFEKDTGLTLLNDIVVPIVGGKVVGFEFSTNGRSDEKVKVLEEALRKHRKARILRSLKTEDSSGKEVKSKTIEQAVEFAKEYLKISDEELDIRMRKAAAIEGDHLTILASLFMDVDSLQLKTLFDEAIQNGRFKELKVCSDPICGIVGRMQRLYEKFEFDFCKMGQDPKYLYRKMCELARDADTLQVLLLFFMKKLAYLRQADPRSDGVFDEVRFILAPLAERIGLVFLADDFRDQFLRLTNPKKYKEVEEAIQKRFGLSYESAKLFLEICADSMIDYLESEGVNIDNLSIYFRMKSVFSAYEKVEERQEGHSYENLMDILGIKIVFKGALKREHDIKDADLLASLLTKGEIFSSIKTRTKRSFDGGDSDWQGIKLVGYNAFGHPQVPIEIQIMTEEMNVANMHGKVAHWWYKWQRLMERLGVTQILERQEPEWGMTVDPYKNFELLRHYWTVDPASIAD